MCPLPVDCPYQSQPHWKSEKSKLLLAPNSREKTSSFREQGPGGGRLSWLGDSGKLPAPLHYDSAVYTSVFTGHSHTQKKTLKRIELNCYKDDYKHGCILLSSFLLISKGTKTLHGPLTRPWALISGLLCPVGRWARPKGNRADEVRECLTQGCTSGRTQENSHPGTCRVCSDTGCPWCWCTELLLPYLKTKGAVVGIRFLHVSLTLFHHPGPSRPASLSFCSNTCEALAPSGQGCVEKARACHYVRIGRKYLLVDRMIKKDMV